MEVESGAAKYEIIGEFHSQTLKLAGFCARA